ncbi:transmembrane protein 144 family protein [Acanthamoeba castellanii str. Neff]|uniref:Transmembrane protein 144 family protein n=1 Tax=Acanthamoeba castellanii (strain ATCC 30010 / Neff) TaxID=1257118 RepID=L8GKD1_ACACF|nr:transmembrane protein 144 family protein [Acanthamoeba castellanii str. Neff]ELR13173.1 transmembrane protein 144 family protein [Acanthamoeba castellanii str. Neff]
MGYVAAAVAVFCFGSNLVPVKKFETGDGMFFQWILCTGIWLTGLVVNGIQGWPTFEPIAMIGGVLWCTGNLLTVPIIKMIGLGLGLLLWGLTNLIMGWATGTFGLFGLSSNEIKTPWLNYLGISLAVASVGVYAFVKPTVKKIGEDEHCDVEEHHSVNVGRLEDSYLITNPGHADHKGHSKEQDDSFAFIERLPSATKRVLGVNFDPPQWLIDHCEPCDHSGGHSSKGLDYVWSHFCGIFLASTVYFLLYSLLKRNKPAINPQVVLPGIVSELGLTVSFPIIATGPGAVGCLWGILLFGEIKGGRNFLFFGAAIALNAVGVALITLGKSVSV